MSLTDKLHTLDEAQQRYKPVAFVAAVIKKFTDDQGSQLAALISYYAFVSLFPLLLIMVTVLGFVLQGNQAETERVLKGTLGQFPIISEQLKLQPLKGSPVALAVGVAVALTAGLGIMSAAQSAFNRVWAVPFKHRPDFLTSRLRSLVMLALLGGIGILSTVAAGAVGAANLGPLAFAASIVVAFAANLILFMAAFKVLTAAELTWRELLPGVVTAAIGWQLLQHLGGYYIDHELKRTGPLYGIFALVLGLLAWLYLGGQITVIAAEVNVVKVRGLWPRSFFGDSLTEPDRQALSDSAETEERVPQEQVAVDFDGESN